MIYKTIAVENSMGLHTRPVSIISAEAQKYQSEIKIKHNGNTKDAKSPVNLLSLCVGTGQTVNLICDGPDEILAMERLTEIFRHINNDR